MSEEETPVVAPEAKRPRKMSSAETADRSAGAAAAPSSAAPAELPKRTWKGAAIPENASQIGFKGVTYNVLCPSFATSTSFPLSAPSHLEWSHRWPLIQADLEAIDGDVICLQEVEKSVYEADLVPYFESKGYKGTSQFADKELVRWVDGKKTVEKVVTFGTATFWRESTFELYTPSEGVKAINTLAMKSLAVGPSVKGMFVGTPPPADVDANPDCWPEGKAPAGNFLNWFPSQHTEHKWFWSW
jgi:hypothetical protein